MIKILYWLITTVKIVCKNVKSLNFLFFIGNILGIVLFEFLSLGFRCNNRKLNKCTIINRKRFVVISVNQQKNYSEQATKDEEIFLNEVKSLPINGL